MAKLTLSERVTALERQVAELIEREKKPLAKDWRRSIGVFTDDAAIKKIIDEGKAIRKRDRKTSQ